MIKYIILQITSTAGQLKAVHACTFHPLFYKGEEADCHLRPYLHLSNSAQKLVQLTFQFDKGPVNYQRRK